jgi:Domain of unknown function (DUF4432)
MATLFGRQWSRDELLQRVGDLAQIAGVRLVTLADGKERGVRAAECKTGTGFQFSVLIDRGLDIAGAEYCGKALAWRSMTEDAHPAYFEREGLGWLRTFYGGLVVTCGMTQAGAPTVDQGQSLGLHGRVSHLPAKNVWADGAWEGDEYRFWVRGKLQEAVVFGENLQLTREISARLGENRLLLRDTVENIGYARTEHMYLYHVNIGFPAVDDSGELISPTRRATPRDEEAEAAQEGYGRFRAPTPGYKEKVYFHEMAAGPDGRVKAAVANRALGHGVYVRYPKAQLPNFIEWKMMGQGNYVVGMEPANCLVMGRADERARGTLQFLEPGERRDYELEIGVLTSREEIDAFAAEVAGY